MDKDREIIAILRGIKPTEIIAAARALIDAGIRRIEVPLNSPDPLDSIAWVANELKGKGEFGAGTVLTPSQVDAVAAAGGSFVVSPDCNVETIRRTRELGMHSYPGVMTPSEAFAAIAAGATGLKFFPAGVLGPDGIKAIKAVLPPELPLYAVGGAGPDNFAAYFKSGCTGFGLGSYLYLPGYSPEEIGRRASMAVAAYDRSVLSA